MAANYYQWNTGRGSISSIQKKAQYMHSIDVFDYFTSKFESLIKEFESIKYVTCDIYSNNGHVANSWSRRVLEKV